MSQQELELPQGWVKSNLENLCELIGGGTPPRQNLEYFDGGILWLTPTEIPKNKIVKIYDSREKITALGLKKSSAKIIPKNSVLLTSRASIGYVAIAGVELTTNQGFASFVCDIILHNYFLGYWLFGNKNLLESEATGTTFKEISKSKLRELEFKLPPLSEQKRIVSKIEELFSKIDSAKQSLEQTKLQLELYKQSLLKSAFEGKLTEQWRENNKKNILNRESLIKKISEIRKNNKKLKFEDISPLEPKYLQNIPDYWMHVYLDSVLNDARYGTSEKCFVKKNNICVIRIPNILSGKLDFSNLKYLESDKQFFENLFLKKNDILICRTNGSLDLVGRSAIVEEIKNNYAFASYLIRLRVENDILDSKYFNFLINSIFVRNLITSKTRTTAGQFNVNLDMLRSIEVPICSLNEQEQIVLQIEQGFSLIENTTQMVNSTLQKLQTMKMSVLKQAFEGKLVPQDPNDEPASALLEKIKSTKESQSTKQRRAKNVK